MKQTQTIPIPASIPEEGLHLEDLIGKIERELLLKALQETNWVKKEAAKLLHINFRSFRYRLDKYGIKRNKKGIADPDEPESDEPVE